MPTRNPARLVVALAIAGTLAVFLLYTALHRTSTTTLTPSQLAGHTGTVAVVGAVVGPVRGDPHSASGMRFGLKDPEGSRVVSVVYHGDNPPPLFREGRSVVVTGGYSTGRLAGRDILTKCPSKYTNKPSV